MNKYQIGLWCGSGYILSVYGTEAESIEEALDKICVYITQHNECKDFYYTQEEMNEMLREDGNEGMELDEMEELYNVLYRDATGDGAKYPIYLEAENLQIIKEVKEFSDFAEVI